MSVVAAMWYHVATMASVGIRELKNRLSDYVRRVRRGEEFLVTDRGRVVAELRQPTGVPSGAEYSGLIRHARAGRVRLGAPNGGASYPRVPRSLSRGTVSRLLDDERGSR